MEGELTILEEEEEIKEAEKELSDALEKIIDNKILAYVFVGKENKPELHQLCYSEKHDFWFYLGSPEALAADSISEEKKDPKYSESLNKMTELDIQNYYNKRTEYYRKNYRKYWNIFGLGKPSKTKINSIIVEINVPRMLTSGDYIAGRFAKDNKRNLSLLHNGNIHIPGETTFWKKYNGKRKFVDNRYYAYVGNIKSNEFPEDLKKFIKEVEAIKKR